MTAHTHLEQMIAFYDPEEHHRSLVYLRGSDSGLGALAYDVCCLWCLGYPDQALKRSQEALTLARELDHPFSLADVLCYAGCYFSAMRRDAQALQEHAEELIGLSNERGIAGAGWSGVATNFLGEALALLGQAQKAIAQIREGMTKAQSAGVELNKPVMLRSLASAQAKARQPKEGLATLTEALALVEDTDERHWEAELYRLRAELLLMQGDDAEAEASLERALEVARGQSAKSWELRVAIDLARLWQKQGRIDEAREMLSEVYCWFTEGFDTPDLIEAKDLLEAIS